MRQTIQPPPFPSISPVCLLLSSLVGLGADYEDIQVLYSTYLERLILQEHMDIQTRVSPLLP
jgi:hypothetical protein